MKIYKIILYICIILLLFIIVPFISCWNDKDICLDSGLCKKGMKVNTENGCIIINEKNCINNNGTWNKDKNECQFK